MVKFFNSKICFFCVFLAASCLELAAGVRVETDGVKPLVSILSWDTEGGERARLNLLRAGSGVGLRIKVDGKWRAGESFGTRVEKTAANRTRYVLSIAKGVELRWDIFSDAKGVKMELMAEGAGWERSGSRVKELKSSSPRPSPPSDGGEGEDMKVEGVELVFPFDPRATATTVLPSAWDGDGKVVLPALISAPDLGQMLLTAKPEGHLKGRLVGSRANHTVDFALELPRLRAGKKVSVLLTPVRLPVPGGLKDKSMWAGARRGWFNAFEPSAQWGDQGNRFSAPAGVLANNVVSDPVSCLIHLWADQALLTPKFSSEIHVADEVRRTLDWWLDHRTKTNGEVYAYWDHANMLDANASPLIAAWDYVEATGDRRWLAERIGRLEFIADYLVRRDLDGDGLVESTHSGNRGTLVQPMRAGSAYDTINAGGKDAYCNALIYRGWRCLADLEGQLKRPDRQAGYAQRADRLKAAYAKTFLNPKTGWLVWWKSENGELHDLASPMISSLAICYGLIEPAQGREIMDRIWGKIEAVGFKRFDLGVPITLVPVRREDYLTGMTGCGVPSKEDGSDTFGEYLNGGCLVSDAVYFITALQMVGEGERGDRVLRAMLERQERGVFVNGGGFQNGVINAYPQGAEFYTWEGKTCGYEGHLTYSYAFLQGVLLRETGFRERLFRPLR